MKATKKILSLVLALMMVLSSVSALAAGADGTDATPAPVTCEEHPDATVKKIGEGGATCLNKAYTLWECEKGHKFKVETGALADHTFGDWKAVNETNECGKPVAIERKCTVEGCTKTETDTSTDAKYGYHAAHKFVTVVSDEDTYPADCTKPGQIATGEICEYCGAVNPEKPIKVEKNPADPQKKHNWDAYFVLNEKGECVRAARNETTWQKLDPAYQSGKVKVEETAATCTKKGEVKVTCSLCGGGKTMEIPALGHNYQYVLANEDEPHVWVWGKVEEEGEEVWTDIRVKGKAPTCTEDGYAVRECVNGCPTTDKAHYSNEVLYSNGHDFFVEEDNPWNVEYIQNGEVVSSPASCTPYTKVVHCRAWDRENPDNTGDCDEVKTTEVKAEDEHKFDILVLTKPAATCSEEGLGLYRCSICNKETKWMAIEKTAHDWDAGKVTKPATCTEDGERVYTCKVCKEEKKTVIPKLNHPEALVDKTTYSKAPVCDPATPGVEKWYCKACKTFIKDEVIPASEGHQIANADDYKVTLTPTCSTDGTATGTCSVCHKKATVTLKATGKHNFGGDPVVIQEGSCLVDQIEAKRCQNRDAFGNQCEAYDLENKVVTKATGEHVLPTDKNGKVDYSKIEETPATCTTAGTREYNCANPNCEFHSKKTVVETIPALGHDWVSKEIENGYILTCTRCNATETIENAPAELKLDSSKLASEGYVIVEGVEDQNVWPLWIRVTWSYKLSNGDDAAFVQACPVQYDRELGAFIAEIVDPNVNGELQFRSACLTTTPRSGSKRVANITKLLTVNDLK